MNFFDSTLIDFINQFSHRSEAFDYIVRFLSGTNLVKGGVLITVIWWGWFRVNKSQSYVQAHIVSTLFGCFIAIALARCLALFLPFRFRPIHEENLDFILAYGLKPTLLDGWSSFPSDHAVLFYTLSIGMFYISKKIGIFALVYTTLFIAVPRIYLGLHYPTDIIGGAFVGMAIVLLCNTSIFIENISQPVLKWSSVKPEIFYPIFFIITYQIADMFNDSRAVVSFLITFAKGILAV